MSIINPISADTIHRMTKSPGAMEAFRKSFPRLPISLATWVASKTEGLHFYYKYICAQRIPDSIRKQLRLLSIECAEKALPYHNRVSLSHPHYGRDLIGSSAPAELISLAKQLVKSGVPEDDMNAQVAKLREDVMRRLSAASNELMITGCIPENKRDDCARARYAMDIAAGAGRSDGEGLGKVWYLDKDLHSWFMERLHEICLNWEVEVLTERERANKPSAEALSLAQPSFSISVTYSTEKRVKPVKIQLDLHWTDRARAAMAMLAIKSQHLLFLDPTQSAQEKIDTALNAPWGPNAKLKSDWPAYVWVQMEDLSLACIDTSWNSDGCRLTNLTLVEIPVEIQF